MKILQPPLSVKVKSYIEIKHIYNLALDMTMLSFQGLIMIHLKYMYRYINEGFYYDEAFHIKIAFAHVQQLKIDQRVLI